MNKKHLQVLSLDFSVGVPSCECICILQPEPDTISHDVLLESLEPHHDLSQLRISYYQSDKYPGWLGNASFSKLTSITLYGCESKYLPALDGLPFLKELIVRNMKFVQRIGHEFYSHPAGVKAFQSLTKLEFDGLLQLSEWSGMDFGDFPRLHTLSIKKCHKLRALPLVPFPSLETLNITDCGSLNIVPVPPLLDLNLCSSHRLCAVSSCHNLTAVTAVSSLHSLTSMVIEHCQNVSAVSSFHSLTTLEITECQNLIEVSFLPSLATLKIAYCPNLIAVSSLPSLATLKIASCPHLIEVSSLPSLATLTIVYWITQR
ncbi:hypothetical protein ACP70R_002722 [Stipagrostis hirtigluma subsp. patula]